MNHDRGKPPQMEGPDGDMVTWFGMIPSKPLLEPSPRFMANVMIRIALEQARRGWLPRLGLPMGARLAPTLAVCLLISLAFHLVGTDRLHLLIRGDGVQNVVEPGPQWQVQLSPQATMAQTQALWRAIEPEHIEARPDGRYILTFTAKQTLEPDKLKARLKTFADEGVVQPDSYGPFEAE